MSGSKYEMAVVNVQHRIVELDLLSVCLKQLYLTLAMNNIMLRYSL